MTGATVSDTFPSIFTGVTFTATGSGGASGFTASGSGNINDTGDNARRQRHHLPGQRKASTTSGTGTLSNTASVSVPSGVTDTNPANNSATDTDAIKLRADLKVTVTDNKTAAIAGQKNTYTIIVDCWPSDVSGAAVSDNFPAEFIGVNFTATATGGATRFTASGGGHINDIVTMPSGSKITYKAKGTINSSATGSISDTGTITAPVGATIPSSLTTVLPIPTPYSMNLIPRYCIDCADSAAAQQTQAGRS